jgi:uncharacterized membrane-anchored protein
MTPASTDQSAASRMAIAARVHRELHERPPLEVKLPAHIHHVAYLLPEQEGSRRKARADMEELFLALGISDDMARLGDRHAVGEKSYSNNDLVRITWELHSEFVTYTFTYMAPGQHALGFGPLKLPETIPTPEPEWERIVALDILVTDWPQLNEDERVHLFAAEHLYASQIQGGQAQVWTTFQLDESGWEHYLILAGELTPSQLGRQIKRLVEIENYYHLILMPLDCFRDRSAELRELEVAFTQHTQEMFHAMVDAPSDEERRWLALLTEHSAKVAKLKEAMRYRLGAARSYNVQFLRILDAMEERKVPEGNQPLGAFLSARTGSAVRGYENFNERLDSLSRGLDRASNMLRTRVEMTVQKQNLELLEGMSKQGRQQLMLQMTVEGLSVIVLSYYLTGLFGYGIKALVKIGWLTGDPVVWQGALLPVAIAIAISVSSFVHHKVRKHGKK